MGIFQSLNLGSPVLQGVAEKEPLETQFSLLPGFGSRVLDVERPVDPALAGDPATHLTYRRT